MCTLKRVAEGANMSPKQVLWQCSLILTWGWWQSNFLYGLRCDARWFLCCWSSSLAMACPSLPATRTTKNAPVLMHISGSSYMCISCYNINALDSGSLKPFEMVPNSGTPQSPLTHHLDAVDLKTEYSTKKLTALQDCEDYSPSIQEHVNGGIEECMATCQVITALCIQRS